jgi:bifunctional DNase/RNase
LIELEVVGVTARSTSDGANRRLRESVQAFAEQPEHWLRLKDRTGDRVLEFGIGAPEAMAIVMAIQGDQQPRPMTHDLIGNLLGALDDVSVLRMTITEREPETNGGAVTIVGTPAHPPPGTFYGAIELSHRGHVIAVDCRPSDGIAVAVRLGVPIVAADALEPVLTTA